jgi:hypothetical protein
VAWHRARSSRRAAAVPLRAAEDVADLHARELALPLSAAQVAEVPARNRHADEPKC